MGFLKNLVARRTEMALLIFATIVMALLMVNLELSQGHAITTEVVWLILGFIGVFTLAHLAMCFAAPHADQYILPVAALLNGIGVVMIYRLDLAKDRHLAEKQVLWTLVGVVLLIAVLLILRDHQALTRYAYLLGIVGLVLLALPLVWPSAINSDARIWISIGPFSVQPGEFSKILLLVFFAQFLVSKRALFNVAGYRVLGLEFPRLRDLAPLALIWGFAILIMAGANDFGPALLLFSTVLGMVYLASGRGSWLLIGAVLVAAGAVGIYHISEKIQVRVENFINPLNNFDTTGFQLSQALFGMSWGGITGTGIGEGYPQQVPVAESDFILAAIGEELGLIGLSAVLILFAIMVSRVFRTALTVRDSFGKLLTAGLGLTITIQVFVVTAGISALMPMTGLTTPFMSQGGSSLMANYILLGIILRISDSARQARQVQAPQAQAPQARQAQAPQAIPARQAQQPQAIPARQALPQQPQPHQRHNINPGQVR